MPDRAEDRWTRALRQIVNVLGPDRVADCPENRCDGCHEEMAEALRIARVALGLEVDISGSPPAVTGEDPEAARETVT